MKKITTRARYTLLKLSASLAAVFSLSGCLLTSPYWNQVFNSHTDSVPLQAWTTSTSNAVEFECSPAYHGGLYPAFGPYTWHSVATVNPVVPGSLDSARSRVYSASHLGQLPSQCWRRDPANSVWYAAVRAKQGATEYKTFTKSGLECLGRENGKDASWFGWLTEDCTQTYSNSDTDIPYVIFRANS